jgi:hypothetical protein
MGALSHNASTSSVEGIEQGGQIQQTKQESSGNQWQQPSINNPTQSTGNPQFVTAPQQIAENSQPSMGSQNEASQTVQTHQAVSSQVYAQKIQEIPHQGSGMGASSHNAFSHSAEGIEQGRRIQQNQQESSGNQYQQLPTKPPVQSAKKPPPSIAPQEGVSQNPQTFKEEVSSSLKSSDAKIAQSNFSQHIKSSVTAHPSSEKKEKNKNGPKSK